MSDIALHVIDVELDQYESENIYVIISSKTFSKWAKIWFSEFIYLHIQILENQDLKGLHSLHSLGFDTSTVIARNYIWHCSETCWHAIEVRVRVSGICFASSIRKLPLLISVASVNPYGSALHATLLSMIWGPRLMERYLFTKIYFNGKSMQYVFVCQELEIRIPVAKDPTVLKVHLLLIDKHSVSLCLTSLL